MKQLTLISLLLYTCIFKVHSQVTATISPGSDMYNAPVEPNTVIQFSCTATAVIIQWLVNDVPANRAEIRNKNVTTTPPAEEDQGSGVFLSSLFIPARQDNDNTTIQCRAVNDDLTVSALSRLVTLGIQGLLDPPPNLTLSEAGDQLTRILTWGAPETLDLTDIDPDIQFYQVCYNLSDDLTCVNVSSSERREFRFPNVCVPLVFTVTAFNVVGEGGASSIVHNGTTSRCDEDTSVSTSQHQVSLTQSGSFPIVTIYFNQISQGGQDTCICIYEVQTALNVSGSTTTSHRPQIPDLLGKSGNSVQLNLTINSNLEVNELYTANIVVDGLEKSSAAINFSTYDVQAVSIDSIPGGLELSCTFASGSQARSCVLTVCRVENEVIDEGSCVNITVTRNENTAIKMVDQLGEYRIREIAEIESDGEMTSVRIIDSPPPAIVIVLPTTTTSDTVSRSTTDSEGLSNGVSGGNVGAIVGGVLVILVVATTIIIIVIVVMKIGSEKRKRGTGPPPGYSEIDGGKGDTLTRSRESQMEGDPCYETIANKPPQAVTSDNENGQHIEPPPLEEALPQEVPPQTQQDSQDAINSDSSIFPLYTEVMGQGKTTAKEGEEDKPDLPQKKLSVQEVRELNLVTEEDIPDVPEQNLTEEDFRKLDLSSMSTQPASLETNELKPTQTSQTAPSAVGGGPLYAELDHKNTKPQITAPDMTEVQYSEINTDEIPPRLPQKKSRRSKESSPVVQRAADTSAQPPGNTDTSAEEDSVLELRDLYSSYPCSSKS